MRVPEWRVFCHLTLSLKSSSWGPGPLCTVRRRKSECSRRPCPSLGQAPSPLSLQARRASFLPQGRGVGPQVAPTPSPACRCPRSAPSVPAPARHADCPAGAGPEGGAERGPRSQARRTRQPPLPPLSHHLRLGRRPARRLSVPWEGVGCRPFQKCFGAFCAPHFPPAPRRGHFSLDFSCNVFTLYLGVGHSLFGSFAVGMGTPPFEQLGNNLVTHHRK